MYLPPSVLSCIQALEAAGFTAYAVGGCVRDAVLGLTPHDYDLCTNARPQQMCQIFSHRTLIRSGEKHGTIGVVVDGDVIEITTFRTEGAYSDSRHPDWVAFVDALTEDLARRDFTMNAMAYSPREGITDPWGGRDDLKKGILRCVGDPQARFREDALRILRCARFAARFHLTVEPATQTAMEELAPLMDNLARERVFSELCQLVQTASAEDILRFAPVLAQAIPELKACIGFQQHTPHHAYDVFTHTAYVTGAVAPKLSLRWAALLHDVGKPACFTLDEKNQGHFYGHADVSAQMADNILLGLKAPTALRQEVVALIRRHMTLLEPEKKTLRRWLNRLGEPALLELLALQQADMGSKGTGIPREMEQFPRLRQLLLEIQEENTCLHMKDLAVNGTDLMALGIAPGPKLGQKLNWLLEQVLDEKLPNEKSALLQALKEDTQ